MDVDSNPRLKIWWRHWSVVLIFTILAGVVIWLLLNLGPWLKEWQDERAAKSAQKQLEVARHNDKYGGKTPEATYNLFINALEEGDTGLASKYFVIEKQAAWEKVLAAYEKQALLNNLISELKSVYINKNMFEFYPSGVWKINDVSKVDVVQ